MADVKAAGRDLAPLVLRIALGAIFVFHGAQKLGLLDQARSWDTTVTSVSNFAAGLDQMGLPLPAVMAWAAVLTEFLGGAFVLLGFATRLASLGLIATMAVAIWKVHGPVGFSAERLATGGVRPGYEFNLLIIAAALALVLTGPGVLALDSVLGKFFKRGEGGKK